MEKTILIGALFLCIGVLVGLGISFKINHTYFLAINEITEKYLKESNENTKEYVTSMLEYEDKFFSDSAMRLAKSLDELNKTYEIPVWHNISDSLPKYDGTYYGKIDDTNSMWKVNYINEKWTLSGYPDKEMNIIRWTDLY